MKRICLALLVAPMFCATAFAANGYTGPSSVATSKTVAEAMKAADDTPVVLTGQITKKLSNETYEFKDATGTIQVEIDDEDLPGQPFDDKHTLRLTGEVDKHLTSREIDVDRAEIVN